MAEHWSYELTWKRSRLLPWRRDACTGGSHWGQIKPEVMFWRSILRSVSRGQLIDTRCVRGICSHCQVYRMCWGRGREAKVRLRALCTSSSTPQALRGLWWGNFDVHQSFTVCICKGEIMLQLSGLSGSASKVTITSKCFLSHEYLYLFELKCYIYFP